MPGFDLDAFLTEHLGVEFSFVDTADRVMALGREFVHQLTLFAELAASGKQPKNAPFHGPDYPADLVASDAVAVTHDEVEGMGVYAQFGMIEEAFADPALLRDPDYRRRVREYLDDDSVSPLLFVRMAARDPDRTNQVFRKLLGRKHFDWALDGEKLMRRRKPHYFEQPRLPRVVPISDRLRPYAAGA